MKKHLGTTLAEGVKCCFMEDRESLGPVDAALLSPAMACTLVHGTLHMMRDETTFAI